MVRQAAGRHVTNLRRSIPLISPPILTRRYWAYTWRVILRIPQESVETMRQALRAANAKAEIVVYPDAGHAFNADYRPGYHEASAKDGWQRMLECPRSTGKKG